MSRQDERVGATLSERTELGYDFDMRGYSSPTSSRLVYTTDDPHAIDRPLTLL